jgi:AcrR family transcriptional regulator
MVIDAMPGGQGTEKLNNSEMGETVQNLDSIDGSNILLPSVPFDIGARTQRQRIFVAMAKSCAEKTFSMTTIADIVGHANISRATFYKHFNNKLECFYATVDSFLAELRDVAIRTHSSSAGSKADAVREAITAVIEHLAAKPDHAKLLLVEATVIDPEIVRSYRDLAIEALKSQTTAGDAGGAGSDPEAALGSAIVLVAGHLSAAQGESLVSLAPELVYIGLLPYVGQEAALAQARLSR